MVKINLTTCFTVINRHLLLIDYTFRTIDLIFEMGKAAIEVMEGKI